MNKIYIFDVDGTLTPSRLPMDENFQIFFKEWAKINKFYLVTGSDIEKLQEQMCMYDIEAEGIFTCCGNEFWIPDPHIVNISAEQVYHNDFKPPETLMTYLGEQLRFSDYPNRCGNHIEDRGTLLNFSVVGRDCSYEDRIDYSEWDKKNGERKAIAQYIREQWNDLDAVIGGQISIDIYPKGNDKSQILDVIESHQLVKPTEYIFYGDGIDNKGNDYPLAKLLTHKDRPYGYAYNVGGWKDTMRYLKKIHNRIII